MCCCSDAKAITDGVVANPEDMNDRLHNWDTLLQNIKTYYQVGVTTGLVCEVLAAAGKIKVIFI